jgi:imidazolonepropionase
MNGAPDLIVVNAAQLVTLEPGRGEGDLGVVRDGAVVVVGEVIAWVGPTSEIPPELRPRGHTRVVDAAGKVVLPGLVDCHTHLVWAGDRAGDFEARLRGESYAEIARRGGGILTTVEATRRASLEELCGSALERLNRLVAYGVTTAEVKSGYGLDLESELKILRAIAALSDLHPVQLVPTFLGAHTVPAEHRGDRARYLDLVVEKMLPAVAEERLALFCDVYVEEGVAFTPDEARRIIRAGRECGMFPKLHVDQLRPGGGAELAAEVGAVSADHLEHVSEAGIAALARAGVTAVLLPGAAFFLNQDRHAPARRLLDAGVTVAIATDCNPGTSPTEALPLCATLACLRMGMTPAEALRAITISGARALGLESQVGSLRRGKIADLVVLDAPDWRHVVYHFGAPLAARVFKGGEEVYGEEGIEAREEEATEEGEGS